MTPRSRASLSPVRSRRRAVVAAVAAVAAALAVGPAAAIVAHRPEALAEGAEHLDARPATIRQASGDAAWSEQRSAADAGWRAFRSAVPGRWLSRWDRRTDRPAAVYGEGIPWIPGRGNTLTWAAVRAGGTTPGREGVLDTLESKARAFVAAHDDLLRVGEGARVALVRDGARSVSVDSGRIWQLTLGVTVDGVPVDGASLTFGVNAGNLVRVGYSGVSDELGVAVTQPAVTASQALEATLLDLARAFGRDAVPGTVAPTVVLDQGSLHLVPWAADPATFAGVPGAGLQHRLAWRVAFRTDDGLETWVSERDAITNERIALYDDNRYACPPPATPQGRVTGGVYVGPIEEVPEVIRPMPFALVTQPGNVVADYNGVFPSPPGTVSETTLSGQYFDLTCYDCVNPLQATVTREGPGNLFLGFGGPDQVGNGWSTRAERNCYHALNVVRQLAAKHLDDAAVNGFLSRTTPALVNIPDVCNAYWDGNGVNFYRSGGGCNNTGVIADVMQHEWGHGLDQFTSGGPSDFDSAARGEGIGDTVAFLSTHDSRLGPYFVVGGVGGLRNADEALTREGLLTVSNALPPCTDPRFGPDVHCVGQLFSQAWWHLARLLRAKYGEVGGWYATERLFFQSLPLSDTYVPDQARSTYDAVIMVDDDDGNPMNGTPNATEINQAFSHHEIASTPNAADSAECAPPTAPALTLQPVQDPSSELWQVRISWPAVPGAREYRVARNDSAGLGADVELATIFPPATTFVDDDVTDGVAYRYRLTVFNAAGCVSVNDDAQSTAIGAILSLAVTRWSLDDTAGNFNRIADPGEPLTIPIRVTNTGSLDATNVTATLSTTHPGVTVTNPTVAFGNMRAGASLLSSPPELAVQLDRSLVTCPDLIKFTIELQSTEGCGEFHFDLPVGPASGPCDAPEPRPRLSLVGVVVGDSAVLGGSGDGDGISEPAERVRLAVSVINMGNAPATNVSGLLGLMVAPAGVTMSDPSASWPDVASGDTASTNGPMPHFEVSLDPSVACAGDMTFNLQVAYDGPSGSYTLPAGFALDIGRDIDLAPFFVDDFEAPGNNGWTHAASAGTDEWQHQAPQGMTMTDPPAAHSGTSIWGTDLGTIGGTSSGRYPADTDQYLDSPPIDCTGRRRVVIGFWRWLAVEDGQFDHAIILVNGTPVWTNPPGDGDDHLIDAAWTYTTVDISAIADNNPAVVVRFELQSDPGFQLGGWNIDDFTLFERGRECVFDRPCVAPMRPGPTGPVLRATGRKSMTHVEFSWLAAPPLNGNDEYRLYRGTAPDSLTQLVTPRYHTAKTFDDTTASGPLLFYRLVMADCANEEGPANP